MGLTHLYSSTYSTFTIHFVQDREANIEYYGPIIRGWIGKRMRNTPLFESIFKPKNTDVKPYFLFTKHSGRHIWAVLSFLGEPKSFISEISKTLSSEFVTNLGGVPARIENIGYSLHTFVGVDIKEEVKIRFLSPTYLEKYGSPQIAPSFEDIMEATVRSANRYLKFFAPDIYPLRVRVGEIDDIIKSFSVKTFSWEHNRMNGGKISLSGMIGEIVYELKEDASPDMRKVLGLTSFFQIGKRVGYGFGKLEVIA